MKKILTLLSVLTVFSLYSCSSGNKENPETKTVDTATAVVETPPPPVFQSFKAVMVQHTVKNYAKWKEVYDAQDSLRSSYGISKFGIARGMEDSNLVIVSEVFTDIAKVKEFAASPGLKNAMKKAGVSGAPKITYVDVIRDDNSPIEIQDRVMVGHHVKDFDTWLKAYDAEGKETRAANGLIDRGMCRGIDDPNMVYLIFAISDMTKAKARMESPELKKIMTDAGVDGPPQKTFFHWVEMK